MTISVIIPTKSRHEDLLNTIETLILQTYMPNEIIIVDQNTSSDIKNAVFSLFNDLDNIKRNNIVLKYIHDSQITGLTQARNRAIEKNESDIVLFLDDDVILEKDFIKSIMEIYKKYPEIYGVSGIITNTQKGLFSNILYKIFMKGNFTDKRYLINTDPKYKDSEYVEVSKLFGGLTSYKKEVFREFKFDENLVGYGLSEDFEFSFRVSRKYKIVITPKARLEHIRSGSGKADNKRLGENLILSKHYFFKKNLDKNFYNYLCYIWLNAGYIVFGILLAVFRRNTDMLIGYIRGLEKLIKAESSDFVQYYNKKN